MKKETAKEKIPEVSKLSILESDRNTIVAYLESIALPSGQARTMIQVIDFLKGLK